MASGSIETEPTGLQDEPLVLPASYAQQRMWFLDRLEQGGRAYNVAMAYRLRGPLDVEALERALNTVVERHESLRTGFTLLDGVPHQLISPPEPVVLELVDLRGTPDAEEQVRRLADAHRDRAFDLTSTTRLFRVALARIGERDHVLSLTLHHIITDGWSNGVLMRELAELYGAYAEGRELELPQLPIQYGDYAAWQQESMEAGALDQQLAYWKQKLAGAPPLLELPTDKPRPPEQSFRGGIVSRLLPPDLLERVRTLAEREGSTMFMTLASAFSVMLSRYSGQRDVVIATPVANRSRVELQNLIGLFVNTLALRVELQDDPSFVELLHDVRETALEAFSNQELPFEKLVQELNPGRNPGHAPVAQVMFALQSAAEKPITFAGLERERVPTAHTTAKFDLAMLASEVDGGLRVAIEYCSDLFEEATVRRMLDQFEVLLESTVADPHRPVSRLELLSRAERESVLRHIPDTERERPVEHCMHELFEAHARETPDAVALVFGEQELSYGELNAASNRLARRLRELGAGAETLVGLFLEPSLELVIAILGVLKAGSAYVPLDPKYPADRIGFVLGDTNAPHLVTESGLLDRLPPHGAVTICLDRDLPDAADASDLEPLARPENLAYVIYTSGSTGRPKGVQVEHRQVARLFTATDDWYAFGREDVWVLLHSYAFDFSVWELWGALAYGGRLVISPLWTTRSPQALAELVAAHGVTVMNATPSLFVAVQEELLRVADRLALRCVVFGGEALRPAALRPWFERLGDRAPRLINMYGITETTVHVTYRPIVAADCTRERSPIGVPIPDLSLYVLDPSGNPVSDGIVGELYVGGAGVARGYLHRPELTAERFIANPFGSGRLYRTGDLARRLPDGELEYRGRIDDQVKVRGFRIELGEIETTLTRHPGVAEAVLVARGSAGDAELAAYVIPAGEPVSARELREHAAKTLPEYMVPATVTTLEAFPLTPNGKVDRRALPAPDDGARLLAEYIAPRTAIEHELARIWANLLQVDRVGAHDDFFALGGHSLMAVRLISRVRESLGVDIPLRAVFERPTLAGIAGVAEELRAGQDGREAHPAIVPARRERRRVALPGGAEDLDAMPASFAQRRLWFLDQLNPESTAYNVPLAVRLRGHLDVEALEHALTELVARHESLRTTFTSIDGEPYQVIRPPKPVRLTISDVGGRADPVQQAQLLVREESRRRIDLSAGPLLRAGLVRIAAEDHILLLTVHHIVIDAWSISVLNRELSELYRAFVEDRAPELPTLSIQYGDYAAWQQAWMSSGELEAQVEYWKQQLDGAPPLLELPTDRPRPARQSFRGEVVGRMVPPETLEALKELGQSESATLFMTLLAAFAVLLSRYSEQRDLVVATPVANRHRGPELENLIGFLVNTLAVRIDLEGAPPFGQLVRGVRDRVVDAFSNQDLPFEKLVEELGPERHLSHAPVAQVLFVLGGGVSPLELPGLSNGRLVQQRGTAKFDLSFFAAETAEGLRLSLEYCADIFDADTAERMLRHYHRILTEVIADPDRPVDKLPMLDAEERRLVVEQAHGEPSAAPRGLCVHELFEAQAARTPDAPAVEHDGRSISYGELRRRARMLAGRLAAMRISAGDVVAVAAERSIDLVTAVLGVLEAGAAYLPIDPAYPEERIAFMLADSGARVLLAQESLRDVIPAGDAEVLILDGADTFSGGPLTSDGGATPEDLAYVLYTSGSTGRPKGVAMPHRALVNLLSWQLDSWSPPSAARTLQFSALSFDVAFQEIFSTLCSGGTLVLVSEEQRRDPETLLRLLDERRVERVFMPFVALDQLAETCMRSGSTARCLREVFTAGEQLKCTPAVRHMFERHPGCVLYNQYGPTETHVVTQHKLEGPPASWPALPPIGRPIAGASAHVLDARGEPVPVGVEGELYLGGLPVARGYIGRPELTAERFVPDPFSDDPEARLYRTGDRARRRVDGSIDYVGRRDDQVKIRGHRLELGEVEAVLAGHPDIRAAAVGVHTHSSGERRLVGYVVPVSRPGPSPGELRAFLRQTLPEPAVPAAYAVLAALPLTPSGKVDRRKLPLPDDVQLDRREFVEPRDEVERTIAEIWKQVLDLDEPVGLLDGFFDLGGHSLLAVRLFAEIRRRLGVWLPLAELFQEATLGHLADLVRQELDSDGERHPWASPVELQRGEPGRRPLFLMPTIHGDLLHYKPLVSKIDPAQPVYGLLQRGIDGRSAPRGTIEDIAADYVQEIRSVQPHGPYLLGGFCFAGTVAFQAAKQLEDEGEEIELVLLIDSAAFGHRSRRNRREKESAYLRDFLHRDRRAKRAWFAMRLAHVRQKVRDRAWFLIFDAWVRTGRQRPAWLQDMWLVNDRTIKRFVTPHAGCRAVLFVCGSSKGRVSAWSKLAGGGLEMVDIDLPGIDHEEMLFEPFVSTLAMEVNARLARLDAPSAHAPAAQVTAAA